MRFHQYQYPNLCDSPASTSLTSNSPSRGHLGISRVCIYSVPKVATWLRGDFNPDPGHALPSWWLLYPPRPTAPPGCPPILKATRETSLTSLLKSKQSLVTLGGLATQGFLSLRMSQALVTSPFNSGTELFFPLGMKSSCPGGRQFCGSSYSLFQRVCLAVGSFLLPRRLLAPRCQKL